MISASKAIELLAEGFQTSWTKQWSTIWYLFSCQLQQSINQSISQSINTLIQVDKPQRDRAK